MVVTGSGSGGHTGTAAEMAAVRAWFDRDGWRLEPADLQAALAERGCDEDTIVLLIDEGADRRRAQPAREEPRRSRNGTLTPVPEQTQVPPQNLEAEESVLGAIMLSPGAIAACREVISPTGGEFYRESHARIWRAALQLADEGVPVHAITLTDRLDERGELADAGGRVRLHELAALVPATANAAHYARIVVELSHLRDLIRAGGEVARLGWERPGDTGDLLERARTIIDQATAAPLAVRIRDRFTCGGEFLFTQTTTARVWGSTDEEVAWAAGEGLMLAGPQGVGKTTLLQQLALARCGLRDHVLGMTVEPDERKVLFIAADRPEQARRSFARMVDESHRELLDDRLVVHRGPPAPLITSDASVLARLAAQADAGTIIVDSLKDVAVKLADDDHGGRINLAFQAVIGEGVQLLVGHHQRKASTDNKKPNKLDDVYGSTWITSGLGSVFLLWGDPGDTIVELTHLKQPREPVGPWNIVHDHEAGATSVVAKPDLVELAHRAGTEGITPQQAAETYLQKPDPTRNDVERIRAKLDRLVAKDKLVKLPGVAGGSQPARYFFNGGSQETLT